MKSKMLETKRVFGVSKLTRTMLALTWVLAGVRAAHGQSEIVLHNFGSLQNGGNPSAGLIRDSAGNLYGTASADGSGDAGVVFRVDTSGHQTVLYSFSGGADGGDPQAGVIADSAGNLYGTTYYGGASGFGVVYKLDSTGLETVLHSFTGGADGANPEAGVVRDSGGNLYGTTYRGGVGLGGVVYELDAAGQETVLHSFTSGSGDSGGASPYAGVILDSGGNLYGTTLLGGGGAGVVYSLKADGDFAVLHEFTNTDGNGPYSGVIRDSVGKVYGTTGFGGIHNKGVIYKLDPSGTETVLYNFTEAGGSLPYAGVITDSAGNFYGTTVSGGTSNLGVVYKVDAAGLETVLHTFAGGADGEAPNAGVIADSVGNLYGTTLHGGSSASLGVVYEIESDGAESVLYSFPPSTDGKSPEAGFRDSAGNLYGTTSLGGASNQGVIYKVESTGVEKVLYSFKGAPDGGQPYGGVFADPAGNLYGTSYSGGAYNQGAIYELTATGQETVLYSFTGVLDGDYPRSGVIRDSAGNLYGTSTGAGSEISSGAAYKLDTAGHLTVLHSFTGGTDGGYPYSGLIADSSGDLYGTTSVGGTYGQGTVYKLDEQGFETVLYSFTGGNDGGSPQAGVIRDSSGNLYGTTAYGGNDSSGVLYRLSSQGVETVLYNFTFQSGSTPTSGVIRDADGNLYGTTADGGNSYGVVYKLDTAGVETVLCSFDLSNGGMPLAGVIRDSAGNLYGTTYAGGIGNAGVVFELPGAAAPQP